MTLGLLNLIIWIPFILVVLVTFILTGISGFRKGLWRALLSLGGVLLSAAVSILFSSLLSKLLAPTVSSFALQHLPMEDVPATLADTIANMVVGCVLSVVLFGFFMIVFSIVFHIISMKVNSDRLNVSTKGLKWAGLGVGLATSLVFALIFLSPAYSTIGTAAGVALQLSPPTQNNQEIPGSSVANPNAPLDAEGALGALKEHALVKASTSGPLTIINDNVVNLGVGSESLSIPAIMDTFDKLGQKLELIANADQDDIEPLCKDFIEILKKDVVHTGWSYSAFNMGIDLLKDTLDENLPEDVAQQLDLTPIFEQLDLSRDEFMLNCDSLLNFMQYALEHDFLKFAETEDFSILYDNGIIAEAGKVANVSEQSVMIKKIIFAAAVSDMFEGDFAKGLAFVESSDLGMITDPDEQFAEAEAILILFGFADGTPTEAILRHPSLGEEALAKLSEVLDSSSLLRNSLGYELSEKMGDDPKLQEALLTNMKESAKKPLGEASSGNLSSAVGNLFYFSIDLAYQEDFGPDIATVQQALALLGKKNFASSSYSTGYENYEIMDKSLKIFAKYDGELNGYAGAIADANTLMTLVEQANEYGDYFYRSSLNRVLSNMLNNPTEKFLFEQLNKNGADPMGINMSLSDVNAIKQVIDGLKTEMYVAEGDYKSLVQFNYIATNGDGASLFSPVDSVNPGFFGGGGTSTQISANEAVATWGNNTATKYSFSGSSQKVTIIDGGNIITGDGNYKVSVSDDIGDFASTYTKEEADAFNAELDYCVNLICTFLGI